MVNKRVAAYWKAVVKATPNGKKVKEAAHGVALKNITIGLSQTKIGKPFFRQFNSLYFYFLQCFQTPLLAGKLLKAVPKTQLAANTALSLWVHKHAIPYNAFSDNMFQVRLPY